MNALDEIRNGVREQLQQLESFHQIINQEIAVQRELMQLRVAYIEEKLRKLDTSAKLAD